MQATNLTNENVKDAKNLFESIEESIENLADEVSNLKAQIKVIFGDHILLDGQFKRITV